MKFAEQEKGQLNKVGSPKNQKQNKEHLSKKDLEELMGVHRDTYERRHGAIKRK